MVIEIPDYVEVSISELDEGHAITAADIKLPTASMKLITEAHAIIAQILIQIEAPAAEATAAVAGAAEPVVLTAKKADEAAKPAAKPGAKAAEPKKDEKKK